MLKQQHKNRKKKYTETFQHQEFVSLIFIFIQACLSKDKIEYMNEKFVNIIRTSSNLHILCK